MKRVVTKKPKRQRLVGKTKLEELLLAGYRKHCWTREAKLALQAVLAEEVASA